MASQCGEGPFGFLPIQRLRCSTGLRIRPAPVKGAFDVWMGGTSDAELRRTGRLADGWLASFTTPAEAGRARRIVQRAAAAAGREIEEDHFGALVPYRRGPLDEQGERVFARVRRLLGPADPDDVFPTLDNLESHLRRLIDAGLSKFVLVPPRDPDDWDTELAEARDAALGLQTRR